jgi:GntR family transcriptional regulator
MELSIYVDKDSGIPIYIQLREQIHLLLKRGILTVGDSMPTVCSLAVELGVNANTVSRVYRDLQNEDLLRLERGVGTTVACGGETPTIGKREFETMSEKARELVALSRRCGLNAGELARLVETIARGLAGSMGNGDAARAATKRSARRYCRRPIRRPTLSAPILRRPLQDGDSTPSGCTQTPGTSEAPPQTVPAPLR